MTTPTTTDGATALFSAIGTRWQIDTDAPLDPAVLARVHARIDAYDRTWSRFRPDSLVRRMATEPGTYRLPAEADELLDLYAVLAERTRGAVSPLVGRSLEALGYDADYRLRPQGDPVPAPRWDEVLERDGRTLTVREPVLLDVGAAGKGHLVDLVGQVLDEAGVAAWTVDAGGDLRHAGPEPVRVGLEDPRDPRRAVGVVRVAGGAVCGSAVNRRAWGPGLHHVVDARTGVPTPHVQATWALAATALLADGLATALFFAEPEALRAAADFTYVRLMAGGQGQWSADLPGEVFA